MKRNLSDRLTKMLDWVRMAWIEIAKKLNNEQLDEVSSYVLLPEHGIDPFVVIYAYPHQGHVWFKKTNSEDSKELEYMSVKEILEAAALADKLGRQLGLFDEDPKEIRNAIDYVCMYQSMDECLTVGQGVEIIQGLLNMSD